MIKETIDKIIEKYYNETDECYNSLRYDDDDNEFFMKDEIENLLKMQKSISKLKLKADSVIVDMTASSLQPLGLRTASLICVQY